MENHRILLKKYNPGIKMTNITNLIITESNDFHRFKKINDDAICLYQLYNHIPGLRVDNDFIIQQNEDYIN